MCRRQAADVQRAEPDELRVGVRHARALVRAFLGDGGGGVAAPDAGLQLAEHRQLDLGLRQVRLLSARALRGHRAQRNTPPRGL